MSFWNKSLAASTKQCTALELTKTVCALGPDAFYLKKGVFTSVPSEYRTRATCPGIKCELYRRLDYLKTPHKCVLLFGVPFFIFQVCDGLPILVFSVLDEVICTHQVHALYLSSYTQTS